MCRPARAIVRRAAIASRAIVSRAAIASRAMVSRAIISRAIISRAMVSGAITTIHSASQSVPPPRVLEAASIRYERRIACSRSSQKRVALGVG